MLFTSRNVYNHVWHHCNNSAVLNIFIQFFFDPLRMILIWIKEKLEFIKLILISAWEEKNWSLMTNWKMKLFLKIINLTLALDWVQKGVDVLVRGSLNLGNVDNFVLLVNCSIGFLKKFNKSWNAVFLF